MIELGLWQGQNLPAFVPVLPEDDQVVLPRCPESRECFRILPAARVDKPHTAIAACTERERCGTTCVLQDRESLAAENVRVTRQVKERHGGVERSDQTDYRCGKSGRIRGCALTEMPCRS